MSAAGGAPVPLSTGSEEPSGVWGGFFARDFLWTGHLTINNPINDGTMF